MSSSSTKPLKTYLQAVAKFKRSEPHAIVIGNEAADADSLISSITYAFLRQWQALQQPASSSSPSSSLPSPAPALPALYLPVVPLASIDRRQMYLRRDVELLLKEADLDLTHLIAFDEYVGNDASSSGSHLPGDVVLVDHNVVANVLCGVLDLDTDRQEEVGIVKEIVDHHKDEGRYMRSAVLRDIAYDAVSGNAEVASTCTLVAERYLDAANAAALSEDIATLLVAVIAVDSINMDPVAGKGTPRDLRAMTDLTARFPSVDRDRLFALMSNAKLDPPFWESLTARDALEIDYKEFAGTTAPTGRRGSFRETQFGISAVLQVTLPRHFPLAPSRVVVPHNYALALSTIRTHHHTAATQPAAAFLTKPDLPEALSAYFSEPYRNHDLLAVMTFVVKPTPRRELLFFAQTQARMDALTAFLGKQDQLQLTAIDLDAAEIGGLRVSAYAQGNVGMSRKQVAPLLTELYSLPI